MVREAFERSGRAVFLSLTTTAVVWAAPAKPAVAHPAAHVRFNNDRIAEVLGFAVDRSQAFRQLMATIEASDGFVYLDEGRCRRGTLRSCLQILPTPGARRLVIQLDPRQPRMSVVGQLAHELQHVVEVLGEADVVDTASLVHFYARVGFINCPGTPACWETVEALAVEARVLRETSTSGRTPAMGVDAACLGAWTLNVEKSTFEREPPPKESVRVYGDRGYGLISEATSTVDANGASQHRHFVYRLDGQDYRTSGPYQQPYRTIAFRAVDGVTADFIVKQDAEIMSTGRRTCDKAGTTMTIELHGADAEAVSQSVTVWTKRRGPTTEVR